MDRSNRQKTVIEFKNTINHLDVTDIYRLLHPITSHSQTHIEHSSDRPHWAIKHVFKNVKDHIRIELKINNRKITGKPPNIKQYTSN